MWNLSIPILANWLSNDCFEIFDCSKWKRHVLWLKPGQAFVCQLLTNNKALLFPVLSSSSLGLCEVSLLFSNLPFFRNSGSRPRTPAEQALVDSLRSGLFLQLLFLVGKFFNNVVCIESLSQKTVCILWNAKKLEVNSLFLPSVSSSLSGKASSSINLTLTISFSFILLWRIALSLSMSSGFSEAFLIVCWCCCCCSASSSRFACSAASWIKRESEWREAIYLKHFGLR